jgi:hypothetical protein
MQIHLSTSYDFHIKGDASCSVKTHYDKYANSVAELNKFLKNSRLINFVPFVQL